ncbi:hypothetical protein ACHMW4_03870 [Mesorhizobium sp. UC22_110]|jgi:hypothetical protein|uniref:hypothetical protein n=1 Tax=unclassified Mesorhizobium TaxID=325217 RepID=UPI00366CCF51
MANTSEKIVNSVVITMIARLSMTLAMPTLAFLFWLYTGWQDDKFDGMKSQIEQSQRSAQQASDLAIKLSERLTTVETKQAEATISSEKFQNATLTRLDRVQDSIVGLSNTVAALTATLQAVAEDRGRSSLPR